MNLPKERKYTQCFKSTKNGSCNYCKTRSWRIGNKIYAMQKDGKWIACSDKKCYLEQGGQITLFGETQKNDSDKKVTGMSKEESKLFLNLQADILSKTAERPIKGYTMHYRDGRLYMEIDWSTASYEEMN